MSWAVQATEPICEHGEGAVWWARSQAFRWVDMNRGDVLEQRCGDAAVERRSTGLSSVAFIRPADDGFVAGSGADLWHFDDEAVSPRLVASAGLAPGERFNEGGCDAFGRVFAGSVTVPREVGGAGLYRFDVDGSVARVLGDVTLGNGLAFTSREDTFYFVDTPRRTIQRCSISASGSVQTSVFVDLSEVSGWPDGICVDRDDAVWVALFGGAEVRRYDRAGRLTDVVRVPTPSVTSCALGGDDGTTLFITTSRMNAAEEALAGAAFTASAEVPGVGVLAAASF